MVSKNKRLLQRVRVPLGFVFAGLLVVFSRPNVISMTVGGVLVLIGLAIRSWAAGHIRKARVLAVSGPYAYTRNPLYLGSAFLGAGFAVAAGVWWLVLFFLVLYLSIYLPVMRVEETDIGNIFGAEYDEYKANVPLFLPRLTPWKNTGTKFDFQLYLHHREYRAALGFGIALALLAAKEPFLNWVYETVR